MTISKLSYGQWSKQPDYGKAFIASQVSFTMGVAVLTVNEFAGINRTDIKGVGNCFMFAGGALLLGSIGEYISYRKEQKKLSLGIAPTGFNLAYKF